MERLADDKPQWAASALKGTMTATSLAAGDGVAKGFPVAADCRSCGALQGRCTTSSAKRAGVTRRGGNNEGRNLRFGVRLLLGAPMINETHTRANARWCVLTDWRPSGRHNKTTSVTGGERRRHLARKARSALQVAATP
ncbi:hypothetical protein MTO96_013218 [Rhipicephalus appendiculatus]